jgi:hypothetical protein
MNQFQIFLHRLTRLFALLVYYGFAQYLPNSYAFLLGGVSNKLRISLVRHLRNAVKFLLSTVERILVQGKRWRLAITVV